MTIGHAQFRAGVLKGLARHAINRPSSKFLSPLAPNIGMFTNFSSVSKSEDSPPPIRGNVLTARTYGPYVRPVRKKALHAYPYVRMVSPVMLYVYVARNVISI